MMNVLALGLLVSSLAAASVWCPPLEKQQQKERETVVVKEGHRMIVMEYESEGFHSVLTQETLVASEKSSRIDSAKEENCVKGFAGKKVVDVIIEEAKEKYTEAASVFPNIGQGISTSTAKASGKSSKETVCDGYGVCREKVSGVLGDTEEKIAEKISQVDKAAKEAVETVVRGGENLVEKAEGLVERVVDKKRTGQDMAGKVKEAGGGLGKTAREKTQIAEDLVEKGKRTGEDLADKAKIASETIVEKANRTGEEMTKKVTHAAQAVGRESRKNLTEILQEVRDVAYDAGMYAISPESLSWLAAILHLLAFSSTYGMCVWLTFGSSYVLAGALPRQQLGLVQSKIYPVYFRAITYGIGSSLLTHLFIHGWLSPASTSDLLEAHGLLSCLVLALMNLFYFEPLANKVVLECLTIEKEEGRGFDIADLVEARIPATVTITTTATAVDGSSSPIATDGSPVMTETSAKTESATRIQGEKLRLVELSKRLKSLNSYSSSLNMAVLMGLTWHLVYLAQSLQVRC